MKLLLIYSFLLTIPCVAQTKLDCVERYSWKFEDYTKKSFFANQIFSKGFSLFFRINDKANSSENYRDSIKNIVTNSFRTALTNWGASLIYARKDLAPELQKYLTENTYQENGKSTYNAPQVFTVDCPENANFIIDIYLPGGKKFPDVSQVLAKAQTQGRAIMLNMQSQRVLYEQRFFDKEDNKGNYNLVPIFAHELGHCFGLKHMAGNSSIMATSVKKLSRFPTSNDGIILGEILLSKVVGTKPGFFSPTDCVGLKVN